jgi:hypothetical protein
VLLAQAEETRAEDVISKSRAAELLGTPLEQFWQEEARQPEAKAVGLREQSPAG